MKAVAIDGKCKLKMINADQPQASGSKVLLKVEQAGICGSDLHMWHNGVPLGLIMGHEFSGVVVDPGAYKDVLKVGDRVNAAPGNPCMECKFCKKGMYNACVNMLADSPGITTPGAYAEYIAVNAGMVHKLPDALSMEEGAMAEPSSVALRAVHRAGVTAGDRVLIVGAGIIGLLCAAWARICGASYIALSESNPARREKARQYGDFDDIFDAAEPKLQKKLLTLTDGGFEKAFDCAGPAPAVQAAIGATGFGGVVMLVGVNFDLVPISTMRANMREITLRGTYGFSNEEFSMSIDYMERNVLKTKRFVDDIVTFEGAQAAFERLTDPSGDAVKIMIKP